MGLKPLSVLCGNLTKKPITIKPNQVITTIHLDHSNEVGDIQNLRNLSDLGLPDNNPNIFLAIEVDEIEGISKQEKNRLRALFEKYDNVFAKDNTNLGKALGVVHKIDSGDSAPIQARPICRSKASEEIAEVEIQKLLNTGLLVNLHSL